MLSFKSNLITKGDVYSCNVSRTMLESEFRDATGITREEMDKFKEKLNSIYANGKYKNVSEYLCIHVASAIEYNNGEARIYFYNLITTDIDNFHYTVSDYCKAMIPKVNAFGIEYKDVNLNSFISLYILNRANVISINNFIVHYNANEIVVECDVQGIGNVISINLVNKEITVLNSDFKPTANEQTYLNMLCQIYCQDKKFMLDVLEDKFVLITA